MAQGLDERSLSDGDLRPLNAPRDCQEDGVPARALLDLEQPLEANVAEPGLGEECRHRVTPEAAVAVETRAVERAVLLLQVRDADYMASVSTATYSVLLELPTTGSR